MGCAIVNFSTISTELGQPNGMNHQSFLYSKDTLFSDCPENVFYIKQHLNTDMSILNCIESWKLSIKNSVNEYSFHVLELHGWVPTDITFIFFILFCFIFILRSTNFNQGLLCQLKHYQLTVDSITITSSSRAAIICL